MENKIKTLFDCFYISYQTNPDKTYIIQDSQNSISYRDCFECCIQFANLILKKNINNKPIVLTDELSSINFIISFWACIAGGQTIFLANKKVGYDKDEFANIDFDKEIEKLKNLRQKQISIPYITTKSVILFQSSGTTSVSKIIQNTEDQFIEALNAIYHYEPMKYLHEYRSVLILLPYIHSYGLSSILEYTLTGSTIYFPLGYDILSLIKSVMDENTSKNINSIEGTPFFYKQLLSFEKRLSIHNIRHIGIGADHVDGNIIKTYLVKYPQSYITIRYGLTEIPSIIAVQKIKTEENIDGSIHSIKNWLSIYDLCVEENASEGELIIKDKRQNKEIKTGDLVFKKDNTFLLKGRVNAIFKFNGIRVNPVEIEDIVIKKKYIKECCIYKNSTSLILEIEIYPSYNEVDFVEYLKRALLKDVLPNSIKIVDTIRRTDNGKKIRFRE